MPPTLRDAHLSAQGFRAPQRSQVYPQQWPQPMQCSQPGRQRGSIRVHSGVQPVKQKPLITMT